MVTATEVMTRLYNQRAERIEETGKPPETFAVSAEEMHALNLTLTLNHVMASKGPTPLLYGVPLVVVQRVEDIAEVL